MREMMRYITIDNDKWEDLGVVWGVVEFTNRTGSTAVDLVLEDVKTGKIHRRTVAQNQIEWLESKDS